jgi:hypothetical protein
MQETLRLDYVNRVLEEEFEKDHQRLNENGTLIYEAANIMEACADVFEAVGITEDNEDDAHLRYAVTGTIAGYFEKDL